MKFYVHNTSWTPVDYDGLTLMRRPLPQTMPDASGMAQEGHSKAAEMQKVRQIQAARARREHQAGYVVIDVETTGLDSAVNEIIELAAVRIVAHQPVERMAVLVRPEGDLPPHISDMTGITPQMLEAEGQPLAQAIAQLRTFVDQSPLVSHNIAFDRAFLSAACDKLKLPAWRNACRDTLSLARREVEDVANYKLTTLAKHFNIQITEPHRALADCLTTYQLYEKLNENRNE